MRKIITFLIFTVVVNISNAQVKIEDIGRIVLNTYLPEKTSLSNDVKTLLETKLNQISSNNGMGGSQVNPRFIITANVNIGTKDIIAGPPQKIAQNIDVTLFVGDAISNTIFSNTTLSLKGVGTNENKAFIDALNTINPKNKEILTFLEEGKTKIINYYVSQCDFIVKEASTLSDQFRFNEAIYKLMIVPEVCKECYFKSLDLATIIFNKKIESECKEKLKEANLIWAAETTESGALKVVDILVNIIPSDNCRSEIDKLSTEIKQKLTIDQQKKYDFELQEMKKKYDTEQKRIVFEKEIAIEEAKHQTDKVIYNNIYWR